MEKRVQMQEKKHITQYIIIVIHIAGRTIYTIYFFHSF